MKKLPVYSVEIDEENSFIDAVALVTEPAIMSNFITLRAHSQKEREPFAIALMSDERRELLGAALIPGLETYRKDPKTGEEYYLTFTPEAIRKAAQIFMKKGCQANLNMQHTATPAKTFIYQSFIVDNSRGIQSPTGLNLPDGSWVLGAKVESPEVWQEVKEGRANGFSIEGMVVFSKQADNTINCSIFDEIFKELSNIQKSLT